MSDRPEHDESCSKLKDRLRLSQRICERAYVASAWDGDKAWRGWLREKGCRFTQLNQLRDKRKRNEKGNFTASKSQMYRRNFKLNSTNEHDKGLRQRLKDELLKDEK